MAQFFSSQHFREKLAYALGTKPIVSHVAPLILLEKSNVSVPHAASPSKIASLSHLGVRMYVFANERSTLFHSKAQQIASANEWVSEWSSDGVFERLARQDIKSNLVHRSEVFFSI